MKMKNSIYNLLKAAYTSRKAVIFELLATVLISVLSLIFVDNNGFRLIVSISCILCLFLIPIFKIFWNGLDNDKFFLFTKEQLKFRDTAIRYSPKLFIALILYMNVSFFFEKTNVGQYIFCSVLILALWILNTALFFFFNLKK